MTIWNMEVSKLNDIKLDTITERKSLDKVRKSCNNLLVVPLRYKDRRFSSCLRFTFITPWFWSLYTEFLICTYTVCYCDVSNAGHFNQCDLSNLQPSISSFPVIMNMNWNENLKSLPIVALDLRLLLYFSQPARFHVPENGPVQRKYSV